VNFGSHLDATVLLARDLVNGLTPGRRGGRPLAPMDDEEHLRAAVAAALADRPNRARAWQEADRHDLRRLQDLAGRLREVFEAVEQGRVDRAAAGLNRVLTEVRARPELTHHDGEPWHLHFHSPGAGPVAGLMAGCATALAMVVGSPAADRLGVCHAEGCDRVYVDATKNASKRFCSSACQNRAKAAAFRARRRAGA
jgi:predicted RNA-binding Zn ribbon-like protein